MENPYLLTNAWDFHCKLSMFTEKTTQNNLWVAHQRHAAVDLRSCGVATFDGWRDQAQLELWTSELGGTSGLEWSWIFWNFNGFSRCLKIIFLSKLLGFHVFQDVVSSWVHLSPSGWSSVPFNHISFGFCGSSTRYLESSWEGIVKFSRYHLRKLTDRLWSHRPQFQRKIDNNHHF